MKPPSIGEQLDRLIERYGDIRTAFMMILEQLRVAEHRIEFLRQRNRHLTADLARIDALQDPDNFLVQGRKALRAIDKMQRIEALIDELKRFKVEP